MTKRASFLVVLALCSTVGFGQTDGTVEDIIEEARAHLYTARQRSLSLLEHAVQERPECPELWEALIYALDVDGQDLFAERASRTALEQRPRHPQLLIARANILAPFASFGVLKELGRIDGYEEEARVRLQLARLGSHGPREPVDTVKPSTQWIDRLIADGLYETGLAALDRGLRLSPDDRHLLARKAVALCLLDRYQAAMAAHRQAQRVTTMAYSVSRTFVQGHPVSSVLRRALSELAARRPEARQHIPLYFGPRRFAGPRSHADERAAPSTERISELRRQLAQELTEVQDYAGAAKVLAPLAVQPASDGNRRHGRINMYVVRWCIDKRRADAEELHQRSPQSLASARFLLASINASRWNYPQIPGKPWATHSEAIEGLCRIGPGVLSSVFDELGPNTISGQDRSPYVHVIERIGNEQDAPVLLDVLALVVREDTEREANLAMNEGTQRDSERRKATETAIHRCLEKLTGAANKADSRKDRVLFWLNWWEENAARLVLSAGHPSDNQKSAQPENAPELPAGPNLKSTSLAATR